MQQTNTGSEYERASFRHEREMAKVRSLIPVKVMKVYKIDGTSTKTQGAVEQAGFVDVMPLISQVDGAGTKQDHETIYHIPYVRSNGGNSAIIMDPVVGDTGYIKCADRDISAFKDGMASGSNTSTFTPNSRRRHDLADSIYMGGILTKKPAQYITFPEKGITITDANNNTIVLSSDGVSITDKTGNKIVMDSNGVTITASTIVLNGNVKLGGSDASLPVAARGTTDSAGDTLNGNFLTKVVGK